MSVPDNNTVIFVIEDPNGGGENTYVLNEGGQLFSDDSVTEIVLEVNEQDASLYQGAENIVYQVVDDASADQSHYAIAMEEGTVAVDTGQPMEVYGDPLVLQQDLNQITPSSQSLTAADGKSKITVLSFDPTLKLQPERKATFDSNLGESQAVNYNGSGSVSTQSSMKDLKPDLWTLYDSMQLPAERNTVHEIKPAIKDESEEHFVNSSLNNISNISLLENSAEAFGPHLPYKCFKCFKSFKKKLSLSVHEIVHEDVGTLSSTSRKYTCPICAFTCLRKKELREHFQEKHDISAFFYCNLCKFVTLSAQEHSDHLKLESHQKALSQLEEKSKAQPHPFLCAMCGYSTINIHRLENHMLTHTDQKDFACPHCDYRGKTEARLKKHMITHNPSKEYTCPFCPYTSHDMYSIPRHMKRKHGHKEKKHKCRECEECFALMCELRVHAMLVHKNTHSFFCTKCDFSCSDKQQYRLHTQSHDVTETLHYCDICNQSFRHPYVLKRHKLRHSNQKPYKCQHCPQTFYEHGDMKRHMMIHNTDRPFTCPICNHKCKFRNSLTVHMKVHADVKGFKCDYCDYTTKYAGNLRKHLIVHRGNMSNRFSCQFCPYQASRRNNLHQHLVKVHLKSIQ